jgi:hypothetical protein
MKKTKTVPTGMKVSEIFKTGNLEQFNLSELNRSVNPNRVRQIADSMQKHGFLNQPIKVTKDLVVIDGQYRLAAAKMAGVEVLYFYDDSKMPLFDNMSLTNQFSKPWSKEDYVDALCAKGIQSYITLREFGKKYPMFSHTERLMLLSNSASATTKKDGFSKGEWVVKDLGKATEWAERLIHIQPYFSGYNQANFVRTMVNLFVTREDFIFEEFMSKLELRPDLIHLCGDIRSYRDMIENIYNFRRRTEGRINLRF